MYNSKTKIAIKKLRLYKISSAKKSIYCSRKNSAIVEKYNFYQK